MSTKNHPSITISYSAIHTRFSPLENPLIPEVKNEAKKKYNIDTIAVQIKEKTPKPKVFNVLNPALLSSDSEVDDTNDARQSSEKQTSITYLNVDKIYLEKEDDIKLNGVMSKPIQV